MSDEAKSQRWTLLFVHYRHQDRDGLTDEEAADLAGLNKPKVSWWTRCSNLRKQGLIEFVRDDDTGKVVKVPGTAGVAVSLSRITPEGIKEIRRSRGK